MGPGAKKTRYPRLLDQVDDVDRDWLLSRAGVRPMPAGTLVFSQSAPIDAVFIIQTGCVKAYYTTAEGQSITFAYWHEGMLMGVPGLSVEFDHHWSAETTEPTTLLQLPRADLLKIIDRSISAAKAMIEILEFKSKYLSRLAQLLGTASVVDRLQIVVQNLCELYGVPDEAGTMIDLQLTHSDIADMVGASRQWVTVSLGKLEKSGHLSIRNRRIILAQDRFTRASSEDFVTAK